MDTKGYGRIPPVLCRWISFLAHALPWRSVPTFVELLIGAMLSRRGFVTEAWLTVHAQRHWTSYYKWLQQGRWSWVRLGQAQGRLLCSQFACRVWYWVIDDSVTCRALSKAPASGYHYNHSRKPNRPAHVRGQGWVNLSAVLRSRSAGMQCDTAAVAPAAPRRQHQQIALGLCADLRPGAGIQRGAGAITTGLLRVYAPAGYRVCAEWGGAGYRSGPP
jgi:hypothetical protein